jgi:hypothetical protein
MSYAPNPFPAPGQGPLAAPPPLRPRRRWYLATLAVLLGGVAWLIVSLVGVGSEVNSFPRVALPATGSPVSLARAGSYVVYYEAPGAARHAPPGFDVRITPASAGVAVASLTPAGGTVTYSFGSREGRAELTLKVSGPGTFLVTAPAAPSGSDLAFGTSIAGRIVAAAVPAIVLMLAGIAGFVTIAVVRARRIARLRSPGGAVYPPGASGGFLTGL